MKRLRRKYVVVFLIIAGICFTVGKIGTRYAVTRALENESMSLGMDWAYHAANWVNDVMVQNNSIDPEGAPIVPDIDGLAELLTNIFSIGHIYQFDFINMDCLCEISFGSYHGPETQSQKGVERVYHWNHVHLIEGIPPKDLITHSPSKSAIERFFNPPTTGQISDRTSDDWVKFPVDYELAKQVLNDEAKEIFIRRIPKLHQPETFAEVYHPVTTGAEPVLLVRVLVDLDKQTARYIQIFRLGTVFSLLLLGAACGYPALLYFRAMKKEKETGERAYFMAHHDVLTNVHNRNDFQESVSDILWKCTEDGSAALLFMFDLNSFKEVNDYFGHKVGDDLLCEFAKVLKKHAPDGGYIARLGGDEFVVVLGGVADGNIRHQDYMTLPRSIRLPVADGSQVIETTIAGGVVHFPRDARTPAELLQAADLALYAAKPNRAGQICEYEPHMKRELTERLELREEFRKGLETSQLEPYYQPIIDMETGQVGGLEALARWNHPTRGLLSPLAFEDIFQNAELSALLGQKMFQKIVDDMVTWKAAGVPYDTIGLNVVDGDLNQHSFAQDIVRKLHENGLHPNELVLEINENCLFGAKKAQFIRHLEDLRQAGCYIALDDFGTGHSSITQLKELPITAVKIDKSFVDDVLENQADQYIMAAILGLGENMGFRLVLEGVETDAQRAFLQEMGFGLAQGYFYAHPLPASQVPDFIRLQNAGLPTSMPTVKAG